MNRPLLTRGVLEIGAGSLSVLGALRQARLVHPQHLQPARCRDDATRDQCLGVTCSRGAGAQERRAAA